jgi:hypothetical protein
MPAPQIVATYAPAFGQGGAKLQVADSRFIKQRVATRIDASNNKWCKLRVQDIRVDATQAFRSNG